MSRYSFLIILVCMRLSAGEEKKRPFYLIGHMANSISMMDLLLSQGANAIEADVTFESNGTAQWVYHGVPCDWWRVCTQSTILTEYLEAAANRSNMVLLMLDLKCYSLYEEQKKVAGKDLAEKVCNFFQQNGGDTPHIIVSIPYVSEKPLLKSFLFAMEELCPEKLEAKVSFEVSQPYNFKEVADMYSELNISAAWQGTGCTNWFEYRKGFETTDEALAFRKNDTYVKKVYRWTVDYTRNMRKAMAMGCDGVLTNYPDFGLKIFKEYEKTLRLATRRDKISDSWAP